MNDMAQCNMVAIKVPNACRFACKSLLLHDFDAKNPAISYHSLGRSGSFYGFKADMEAMALWLRYCIYHYIMNALMV